MTRAAIPGRTTVVFRYDDCSAVSSLDLERRLVDVFADLGASITLAVIPHVCAGGFRDAGPQTYLPLPDAKRAFLQSAAAAGAIELALHGWHHQARTAGVRSEFEGLPADEQRRRIALGVESLASVAGGTLTTFVPPWNAYDEHTIAALEGAGFRCLSGSLRGPFPSGSTLAFLPYSCWLKSVPNAVAAMRLMPRAESVLVIMLHDFDFVESRHADAWITIAEFRTLVGALRQNPRVYLRSLSQAAADGAALPVMAYRRAAAWREAVARFPYRYRVLLENQAFWPTGAAAWRQVALSAAILAQDVPPTLRRKWSRVLSRNRV